METSTHDEYVQAISVLEEGIEQLQRALARAAAHFRAMGCETMAKECEEALR
jgi:hypothetical protein